MKKKLTIIAMNALVIAEAKKLKKNATPEEIALLDFNRLETSSSIRCVYGQMTGSCWSARAIGLIETSCKRVFKDDRQTNGIIGTLNGSPIREMRRSYWSPIEIFIDRRRNKDNGNNKRLIDFLKGETKTLILK